MIKIPRGHISRRELVRANMYILNSKREDQNLARPRSKEASEFHDNMG